MKRALLDTHTFIWVSKGSHGLSRLAKQTLALRSTVPHVSVVSLGEIAMKIARGALEFDVPLEEVFARKFKANGYLRLDITDRHPAELSRLPHPDGSHGDPFDRLLATQARVESLELLSADAKLDAYGVRRLW